MSQQYWGKLGKPLPLKEQVRIIEGQLSNFDTLMAKMTYLHKFFDSDPKFSKEATDIVRSNISRSLPK